MGGRCLRVELNFVSLLYIHCSENNYYQEHLEKGKDLTSKKIVIVLSVVNRFLCNIVRLNGKF